MYVLPQICSRWLLSPVFILPNTPIVLFSTLHSIFTLSSSPPHPCSSESLVLLLLEICINIINKKERKKQANSKMNSSDYSPTDLDDITHLRKVKEQTG